MKIYTIGYTQKSAEQFFGLLVSNGVERVLDVRLNNTSQFTRFSHRDDLPYFLSLHNIEYRHLKICAPTKDLLRGYRKGSISWDEYVKRYVDLLNSRNVLEKIELDMLKDAALLCVEAKPDFCHRRLLAEYLSSNFGGVEVIHL